MLFLFMGSFPSLWSVGFFPPLRSINVIFFAMLIFSMLIAYKIVVSPLFDNIIISQYTLFTILVLFVFSYIFMIRDKKIFDISNNIYHSYKDLLNGEMFKYREEMKERYKFIRNSKKDTVYVEPLKIKPETIFRSDLRETN